MLLTITGIVQVPILLAIHHVFASAFPWVAGAAAIWSLLFLFSMRNTFRSEPRPWEVFLALWPFFCWWTWALVFLALAPFALLAATLFSGVTLNAALAIAILASALATIPAVVNWPRIRTIHVPIRNLPQAFHGYRIAQISDLHCGPFASRARISRWVAQVNGLAPDLVAVTGDLIVHGAHYVATVSEELGRLRGKDGVLACMGNHDYFTDGDAFVAALETAGLVVLRNRGTFIERTVDSRTQRLFFAGVDDTWTERNDLARALAERAPGEPTILLAHDPALFPSAAAAGVELTLSGHTHGGQLAIPGMARRWNLARLMTAFTTGLYKIGDSSLYVNRGLGTTGPPIRLGVQSEIALLVLSVATAIPTSV